MISPELTMVKALLWTGKPPVIETPLFPIIVPRFVRLPPSFKLWPKIPDWIPPPVETPEMVLPVAFKNVNTPEAE